MQYLGDFAEDATVYIPFNTFTSDNPSTSATITNLADADIKVHKDGSTTEIATDGATVAIDFDTITGNHLITIDTSVHADYSTGSDYLVRIEGTTVDGATINAWVGHFSIQNRYMRGTDSANTTTPPTTAAIADAVWDEATTGHVTSGTFGEQLKTDVDAILVDTAEIGAAGAGLTEAGGTGDHLTAINLPNQTMDITGNITGNLSGSVGSVGSLAAQAKADVNAEVLDVVNTDTFAELADVPGATVSLATKIGWLFMLARNKITQTATTQTIRNDADSADIGTSTVSDNGTTFTRGEWTDAP